MCPATFTGKLLNPRLVIHDIKVNLLKNGPLIARRKETVLPLIGGGKEGSVADEVLWACTTCGCLHGSVSGVYRACAQDCGYAPKPGGDEGQVPQRIAALF